MGSLRKKSRLRHNAIYKLGAWGKYSAYLSRSKIDPAILRTVVWIRFICTLLLLDTSGSIV